MVRSSAIEGLAGWMMLGAGTAIAALWALDAYLGGWGVP